MIRAVDGKTLACLLVAAALLSMAGCAGSSDRVNGWWAAGGESSSQPAPSGMDEAAAGVRQVVPASMSVAERQASQSLLTSSYLQADIAQMPVLDGRAEALQGRGDYYLGHHDVLRITVFGRREPEKGSADIVRDTEIRDDGMISYPLVGDIPAAGRTVPELHDEIVARLSEYIKMPRVDIQIVTYGSRNVAILGEVEAPQVLYLRRATQLMEVIARAGGLTPQANLKGAYLVRQNRVIPLDLHALFHTGDLRYNIHMQRNDVVYIPNVQDLRVYVIGEINKPAIVPFAGKLLTVAEAIASAGDFKNSARRDNIKVIRGGLVDPTVITIDFKRILAGDVSENIPLRSEDIVFVPASLVGQWNKILDLVTPSLELLLFANTVENLTD